MNFTLSALQGSGSTQACESFFRVMKHYEKQAFGQRTPSLHEMIPYISMAIDKRFLLRKILVGNKRMRYFHEELEFQEALDQASWVLNPTGMKLLYNCIEWFEKRRDQMIIAEEGVCESFSNGQQKLYRTDGVSCDCSFFHQMFLCRHIIFFRKVKSLAIFYEEGFHSCLLKNANEGEEEATFEDRDYSSPPSPGMELVLAEERNRRKAPTHAKKFNMALDAGKEMAEVISTYDEETFNSALEANTLLVKYIRKGVDMKLLDFLQNPDSYVKASISTSTEVPLTGNHQMCISTEVPAADDLVILPGSESSGQSVVPGPGHDGQLSSRIDSLNLLNNNEVESVDSYQEHLESNIENLEVIDFNVLLNSMVDINHQGIHAESRNEYPVIRSCPYAVSNDAEFDSTEADSSLSGSSVDPRVSNQKSYTVTVGLNPVPEGLYNEKSDDDNLDNFDSESLPDIPYTSFMEAREVRNRREKEVRFENIVKRKGRPCIKRDGGFKLSKTKNPRVDSLLQFPRKVIENPPKVRKTRSDKGKKRGKYNYSGASQATNDENGNVSHLRGSNAPKNIEALNEEFGFQRPDTCFTCMFALNFELVGEADEVVVCTRCKSYLHSSCLTNCRMCETHDNQ